MTSENIPDAFNVGSTPPAPPAPPEQAAQVQAAAMSQPVAPVTVVAEPQDPYSQQMRTIFEQVTATDSKNGYVVENGHYVNYVPSSDESVIRRMAKKGWTLDTNYRPTPGMSNYMRLIIPVEIKDQMDRDAAERTAESQGIRLKDPTNIRDLASNELNLEESKSAMEILHNLPSSVDELDES